MCNKVSYSSKNEASKDAKFIRKNNRWFSQSTGKTDKSNKLNPYLCPFCDRWHLTSLSRNATRTWGKKSAIINKTDIA